MFTGIIEELGVIKAIGHQKNLIVLDIDCGHLTKSIKLGDSVAINGVCLTATAIRGKVVAFDLMKETILKTSLKELKSGHHVNLELALKASSRLGGHFVTGHVDEVAAIKSIVNETNWVAITISISKENRRYLVKKGSITVDGISLTVGKVGKFDFTVYLIPFTLKRTNLFTKTKGDLVNLETDILAKYVFNK